VDCADDEARARQAMAGGGGGALCGAAEISPWRESELPVARWAASASGVGVVVG